MSAVLTQNNKRSRGSGGVSACCHNSSRANCRCNEDSTLVCWAGPAAATVMTRIQITNKGPPVTAAFEASDKSYHHLNIPTTKNTDTALLDDLKTCLNKLSPPSKNIYYSLRSVSPSISTLIQGQDTGNMRNDVTLLRE